MGTWQKGFWAIFLSVMLIAGEATVFAEELEGKLQSLQDQAADQQKKTDAASARVSSLSEELRVLQADVDEAESSYKAAKEKLDTTQLQINENQAVLDKTERELQAKTKILDKRVRDIYINGQISYIDVLFGAKDFSDFMTRMDLLKRIIKYDYDLITKVQNDKKIIVTARAELDKEKDAEAALLQDANDKKAALNLKKKNKDKLLEKAQYDRATSERMYQELQAASRQVENMIRQSHYGGGAAMASGSGAMIWPISGSITSEFGWRTHPIFGTSRFHSGLDIAGDYGDPIRAAAGGKVIYAGWISGYGNAVIIDHGGGVSSLYGHNSSLNVSEGQSVSQGQVIAYCGSTGNSTGPHCHFEVRENGEPVSPYGYL